MRNYFVLGFLALLAACGPADGYQFEQKEWNTNVMTITMIEHSSVKALNDAAKARGTPPEAGRELMGWGIVNNRGKCELHVVDPEANYMPEFIGHEVTHCKYGRFHK